MMLEIQVLVWDRLKEVAGLNWLMGYQPSPLDNWISNGNREPGWLNELGSWIT